MEREKRSKGVERGRREWREWNGREMMEEGWKDREIRRRNGSIESKSTKRR